MKVDEQGHRGPRKTHRIDKLDRQLDTCSPGSEAEDRGGSAVALDQHQRRGRHVAVARIGQDQVVDARSNSGERRKTRRRTRQFGRITYTIAVEVQPDDDVVDWGATGGQNADGKSPVLRRQDEVLGLGGSALGDRDGGRRRDRGVATRRSAHRVGAR